ncbi:MAG: hypothetical protein ACM3X6_06965 [Patescibacteria group bacterium]
MKRRGLLAAICLILFPTLPPVLAGQAGLSEAQILARVEKSRATEYYQGLLVTVRRAGSSREDEVARAWFGPQGRQALEVVTPSWRSGELLVVDAVNSWLYYPDCGAVLRLPAKAANLRLDPPKGAVLDGTERLGDREAYVLSWEIRRGTRRIWIDAQRFVPLKREDRNRRGELILAQTLEGVEFPSLPPQDRLRFTPDPDLTLYTDQAAFYQAVSIPHVQRGVDFQIRQPAFLPPGLSFRRAFLNTLPQLTVVQLRYGGQGRAMSLFEYRATRMLIQPERQFLAGRRGGKLNFLRWRVGEIEMVLVGNLPAPVLREVAESIKPG